MSIPVDYVRYDVKLGEGVSGIVYYGYNPNVVAPDLASEFEDCASTARSCSFVKQREGGIEAVYSGSREDNVVHVLLDGINGSNSKRVQEFLENFRPCRGSGADVVCRETAIFRIKRDGGN